MKDLGHIFTSLAPIQNKINEMASAIADLLGVGNHQRNTKI
jgi:hypothetical protein